MNKNQISCITISIIGVTCVIIILAFLLYLTEAAEQPKLYGNNVEYARFEVVEQIVAFKDRNGNVPALILRDKETNIKYIYVLNHSSSSLTRLWEK